MTEKILLQNSLEQDAVQKLDSRELKKRKPCVNRAASGSKKYESYWDKVARERFELSSRAPEAPMLDHYTTGLQTNKNMVHYY